MPEREEIIARLRRIEGQVRGLARMVEEEAPCEEILTQLLAARSALEQAGLHIVRCSMDECLPEGASAEQVRRARQQMRRIMELLLRME